MTSPPPAPNHPDPSLLLPDGLRDRLPPQAEAASRVTRALIDAMAAHGYARVAPPLAEYQASLIPSADSEAALVRFTDPVSRRTLAIRPDITRQVARIARSLMAQEPRPLRLCYAGQVMTLAPPTLRPAREMLHVGAELIGKDSLAAAQEVVTVALDALDAAGIGPVSIDFTLPDAVALLANGPLPLPSDALQAVQLALDAKDAGRLHDLGAVAYLPLLACTGPLAASLARLRDVDRAGVLAERLDALEQIAGVVGKRAAMTLDPSEHRGFVDYSWFGFSLFLPGHSNSIGRGGSYRLGNDAGNGEVAVGFSFYPDPLINAGLGMEAGDARRLFLPLGHDPAAARDLRGQGWQTIAALDSADDARTLGCGWHLKADGPTPLD